MKVVRQPGYPYDPKTVALVNARGKRVKEYRQNALSDYATAMKLDPTKPEPYEKRAYFNEILGNRQLAISDYSQSIR